MGKVVIEYWECDCCRDRFDKESFLRNVELPARRYDVTGKRFVPTFVSMALCECCQKQFWEISDEQFARIEIGNGMTNVFRMKISDEELAFKEDLKNV